MHTGNRFFLNNPVKVVFTVVMLCLVTRIYPLGYTINTIDVGSFYLEDRKSSRVIIQRNQNSILPAASTIKLIAAMVAKRHIKKKAVVRIPREAARIEPTKAYLRWGERFYADDLIHAMIIKSANDAALAIAIRISGSEKKFVKLMNLWCRENNISNTVIHDSTGISRRSVSTAKSLSRIFKIFIRDKENLKMLKYKRYTLRSIRGRRIVLKNSNNLSHYRNERGGIVIGKTGFTKNAGFCFTGMVQFMRNEYYIVIMGATMAWHQISVLMNYANDRYLLYKRI